MGFAMRCAIVGCAGPEADAIAAAATQLLPCVQVRRFDDPFPGLIAACFYDDVCDAYDDDPARFGIANPLEAHNRISWGVVGGLPDLSERFPAARVGYVDVECIGGVCPYGGLVMVGGAVVFRVEGAAPDGHQRVLAAMGQPAPARHFTSFTRAFWAWESG